MAVSEGVKGEDELVRRVYEIMGGKVLEGEKAVEEKVKRSKRKK